MNLNYLFVDINFKLIHGGKGVFEGIKAFIFELNEGLIYTLGN